MAAQHAPTTLKALSRLQGSRVLVFGGTSGIGFCVAEMAVESGASVVLTGSNAERITKTAERLQAARSRVPNFLRGPGGEAAPVTGFQCDLSDVANLDANLEKLFEQATEKGEKKLDHVVYTAGDALKLVSLSETSVEALRTSELVRFTAPTVVAKFLPRYVNASVQSSFTLTSGVNGWRPRPGWSTVTGIGGGVEGLGRGLAVDLAPIRVNTICPGAIKTELWDSIAAKMEGLEETYRKRSLTNTIGNVEDCAEAYLFLMKSAFTTGTVIIVDGGSLIGG